MAFPEDFLDRLREDVPVSVIAGRTIELKRKGKELVGLSPFNKESTPSFTIYDGDRRWHDFSSGKDGDVYQLIVETQGVEFPDAVAQVAKIAGVALPKTTNGSSAHAAPPVAAPERRELPKERPSEEKQPEGRREIVGWWDYTAPDGELLYQVMRFQFRLPDGNWKLRSNGKPEKTFRQRRPDPAKPGEWINNLDGVEHGLYPLVEFNELKSQDAITFIPEGEGKVDTLREMGFVAVSNSGGAKHWSPAFAELFRDLDVVIPIDNDQPGHDRAEIIAKSLHGIARRIRVLDFAKVWPDAPKGADVTDWKKAREGSAEELSDIVEKLPDWRPAPFVSKFGGQSWEDIGSGVVDPYPWVVENIIPAGESVLMFGESGSGKSFDAFDMAMCIARGVRFNGHNVEPGLVIYAAAEAGKGFEKRKRAYCQHHGIDPRARLPFYLMTKRFDLFHSDDDANALIEEMKAIKVLYPNDRLRLSIVDTLSATTPGMNENASQDVGPVKSRIDRIRVELESAVLLVHHKPKGGSTPRGHGSLTADYETTIEFGTSDLTDDKGRKIHVATVQKQREGKSGLSWRFTLPVVEVGKNKWGSPDTSCVVVPVDAPAGGKGFRANDHELAFMRALLDEQNIHGVTPGQAGLDLPASIVKVVDAEHVRAAFKRRFIKQDDDGTKHDARVRQAWSRATKVLRRAHVIGYDNGLVWWSGRLVIGLETATAPVVTDASSRDEEYQGL